MKRTTENGCERVQELLSAYVDGELNKHRSWAVERHLAACPACRAMGEQMREVSRLLCEGTEHIVPPATLCPSVMSAVHGMPRGRGVARVRVMRRVAGALAAVGCLTVLGAAVWLGGEGMVMKESDNASLPDSPSIWDDVYYCGDGAAEEIFGSVTDKGEGSTAPEASEEHPTVPAEPSEGALDTLVTLNRVGERAQGDDAWSVLIGEWQSDGVKASFDETGELKLSFADGREMLGQVTACDGTTLELVSEDGVPYVISYGVEGDTLWLELDW